MTVIVFRHVPFEDLGLIRPALEGRGITIEYAEDPRRNAGRLAELSELVFGRWCDLL